jgi:hypothetical protein
MPGMTKDKKVERKTKKKAAADVVVADGAAAGANAARDRGGFACVGAPQVMASDGQQPGVPSSWRAAALACLPQSAVACARRPPQRPSR